jgi:hypothetical protein
MDVVAMAQHTGSKSIACPRGTWLSEGIDRRWADGCDTNGVRRPDVHLATTRALPP